MDIAHIIDEMLSDLALVAASSPNERLPKEEQIRCSIYAAIRPLFHVVCAERGYGSIDDGSRIECDLWACSKESPQLWIEFKRCWSVKGWNNKPPEQLGTWRADVEKLRQVPLDADRYFVLVGLFDCDPSCEQASTTGALGNIRHFHPSRLVHAACKKFGWRTGDGISWIGAWVWRWPTGSQVETA
jgi:hypothetical protein